MHDYCTSNEEKKVVDSSLTCVWTLDKTPLKLQIYVVLFSKKLIKSGLKHPWITRKQPIKKNNKNKIWNQQAKSLNYSLKL